MVTEVMDKLIGEQTLRIVPIVGMGGIGKTTFARYVYTHENIVDNFGILAWITVSQDGSRRKILEALCEEVKQNIQGLSENEMGEKFYQQLWGRKYLIVMDDVWSVEAWNKVKIYFPVSKGSRIIITTRLTNLALQLSNAHIFHIRFLDEDESWNLLCKTVFDELDCPTELVNIGKKIARRCRGLPLSIVVTGGLLKRSNMTLAYWVYILENLNSLIHLENDEYTIRLLQTSYKELPVYLKPCFLYMGVFQEDYKIRVKKLIKLWVAEGILRPNTDRILEEVAEEYIHQLIDRNLISVDRLRWNGKAKVCKIHDMLRDVCIKEAQKQRFLCVMKSTEFMNMERRISIHDNTEAHRYSSALESAPLARSLISTTGWPELAQSLSSKLLRVYSGDYYINSSLASHLQVIFKKPNLRYLDITLRLPRSSDFPSSWFLLWNLQTLKIDIPSIWVCVAAPSEIWGMPLLRHVMINFVQLPDILRVQQNVILEDLQTLSSVRNFKCTEVVLKKVPNITTLKLDYQITVGYQIFCLNNIGLLGKLQSLYLSLDRSETSDEETFQGYLVQNLRFPESLKKLTLYDTRLKWEECMEKIGSLPHLEYLKLGGGACCGEEWEPIDGQFRKLKYLELVQCTELRYWRAENNHFPSLQHLVFRLAQVLEEIPLSIGDLQFLKSITLELCSASAVDSAKMIKDENVYMQLHITDSLPEEPTTSNVMSYEEGFAYMRQNRKEKFNHFVDVLNDFNAQRSGEDDLKTAVKVLVEGDASLTLWFKTFYPTYFSQRQKDQ